MKGLLLLSGGFDSGVAAYVMLKQNIHVDAIHFSLEPFTDGSPEKKSIALCRKLGINKLYVVKHSKEHEQIVKSCRHKYYFIISRRLMYRTAEKLGLKERYDLLIDGTNIGQVSSQTLSNLSTIRQSVSIPVISPLLCYDKQEIINLAKKIGTYEISKGPEMCNVLGPKHPATRSSVKNIEMEENIIDTAMLVNNVFEQDRCNCVFL